MNSIETVLRFVLELIEKCETLEELKQRIEAVLKKQR